MNGTLVTPLQDSSLTTAAREKFCAGLEKHLKQLSGREDREEEGGSGLQEELSRVEEAHPQYPALHRGLEVRHTPGQGRCLSPPPSPPFICPRFVVARSALAAGTVLLAEEPLGWALDVERTGTHCQHCLGLVTVIVPCPACVSVAFCSQRCKEVGWQRVAVYSRPG